MVGQVASAVGHRPSARVLTPWLIGAGAALAGLYLAPPTAALAVGLLVLSAPLGLLLWRRPELAMISLAFFTSGLIPREAAAVPLPVGRLDMADLSLLSLVGIAVLRGVLGRRLPIYWWPVAGPLLVYFGVALFSALYAALYHQVPLNLVVGELRTALYAAGCVLAAPLLTRRRQFSTLLVGLFAAASLTATVVVLQQFLGADNRLLAGMQSGSWQIDAQHSEGAFGATRIVPPGHVLLFLMSIVAFCMLVERRPTWQRALLLLMLGYLNFGLLLTYTRAQWVASAIAIVLAVAFMPRAQKARLARGLLVATPIAGLAIGGLLASPLGSSAFMDALSERASSILTPNETLSSASLGWRQFENAAATETILANPLLGVGLGNDYRPITLLQGEARGWLWDLDGDGRLTRFVHNSYLYLTVKMGLPALAVLGWFAAALLLGAARTYRRLPPGLARTLMLPVACSFAGLLEWSIFEAHLMLPASMATVGMMVGMVGAAAALGDAPADRSDLAPEADDAAA